MLNTHLGTLIGIILCALCVYLVLSGIRWAQPKNYRIVLVPLIVVWYWTTTVWAASTKQIVKDLDGTEVFPSSVFWLTLIPQVVSTVLVAPIAFARGVTLLDGSFKPGGEGGSLMVTWFSAGAGYFFGQLFTVMSLAAASPGICFVVKALEPLTTASLAIPVLQQTFNWRLMLAIFVSCVGVVITALGSHSVMGDSLTVAIISAVLANAGFSSRACVVKKQYSHGKVSPIETFFKVSLTGCICGFTMLVLWLVALFFRPRGFNYHATFGDLGASIAHSLDSWVKLSICYFLYQCASLLLLDCLLVESHALLVAMKHIFVVIIASILTHARLSLLMILGVVIAAVGVLSYIKSPQPESLAEAKPILPQTSSKNLKYRAGDLPSVLKAIIVIVVVLGVASPVHSFFV